MKLLHNEPIGQSKAGKEAESRPGPVRRTLLNCAIIGAFALSSPLMEGTARAQTPSPEQAQPPSAQAVQPNAEQAPAQRYTADGRAAQVSDAQGAHNVYVVSSQSGFTPNVTVEGPCRLTVRFYPAVLRERFPTPESEYARQVDYTLGPSGGQRRPGSFSGTTRSSQYTSTEIGGGLVVGSPLEHTIEVPSGRNILTVTSPNGLLEIVRVEPLPVAPVVRPPVQPVQVQPAQPARVEAPSEGSEDSLRPAFTFEGSRTPLYGLGTSENRGDIYAAEALGHIRLNDTFSLIVGGMFSTYGLSLSTTPAEMSLRSYSGDIAAGLSFQSGGHYLYGLGFGGYRGIQTNLLSVADGRRLDELSSALEFGGAAGYNYSRFFGLRVQGGNNPFNPLSARIFGAIPYTWAEGVYPYVEANLLWLHTLRPAESPGFVGLSTFDENAFHIRALAGIPIYRIGPLVPIAIAGGEFNVAGGSVTSGTGIFGGGLRTFFTRGLDLEAFGAATLHGDPLILLRMGYRM
ncbi:MAG: hypothetical protein V1861_00530 [Candidatus Micrarchaeota archaeon]